MNHIKYWVLSVLFTSLSYAQGFQGIAYYQSKTSVDFNFGGRDMPEAQKKMIQERMKRAFEKTFELHFTPAASIYKEQVSLDQPGGGGGGMMFSMMAGGGGTYYKNVQEGTYSNETETFGKIFLIQDNLKQLAWTMTGETKKIGNYTCYKATAVRAVDTTQMTFRMGRPPREEAQKKDSTQTNSLFQEKKPTEITITAWYTMDIPVAQGPAHYWGLPGLIMEVSDDRTVLLCSKIVLNPAEKLEIKAPSKGKKVSQAEFDQIMKDKVKEMSERFQSGGGRSGSIMIRQ
jgi:GLPGLI family protein